MTLRNTLIKQLKVPEITSKYTLPKCILAKYVLTTLSVIFTIFTWGEKGKKEPLKLAE